MNDDQRIRELLAAYALALDADDIDSCLELFTEDGQFIVYGKTFSGRTAIGTMFTDAPRGLHMSGAALVTVQDLTATARSQVLFIDSTSHRLRPALYDDVLVVDHGQWRFRSRRCQFLTPAGLADRPANTTV
jgi:uncharacterized protein (TIGR02246 family)